MILIIAIYLALMMLISFFESRIFYKSNLFLIILLKIYKVNYN